MENIEMKNLSDASNLNKTLKIESIILNQDDSTVDVKVIGLSGDKYVIKVAEKDTAYNFNNQEITYYSPSPVKFNIELVKGRSYEFSLFDSHNTVLDVFTFKSPKDFKSEKQEVMIEEPVVLAKTSDINFTFIFSIIFFLTFMYIKYIKCKYRRIGKGY